MAVSTRIDTVITLYTIFRCTLKALNLASGIFTAPTSGRFFFSFNALSEIGGSRVHFRLTAKRSYDSLWTDQ